MAMETRGQRAASAARGALVSQRPGGSSEAPLLSASERSVTRGGVQLGTAAQEDDRRGDTASDAGRGGTSVAGSLAAYLGHERPE